MPRVIDITGHIFGRLKVIKQVPNFNHNRRGAYWECICECGKVKTYYGSYLRNGDTKSCGCYKIDIHTKRLTTHNMYGKKTYYTWKGMINRCCNPSEPSYPRYGGRGITVCDKWRVDFLTFLEDMGEKPKDFTLERVDNEKGYYKENCKWANRTDQARNTRRHISIGDIYNDWKILDRTLHNAIYKAKAECTNCGKVVIRQVDNLKNRKCLCHL